MKEEWKDIPAFEGVYQVSSFGRLKSYKASTVGRILKNTHKGGGYFSVVLEFNGLKTRYTRMHRLVAEAFIDNPNNLPEVNHKDCNKQNNNISNLEWVTRLENHSHAIKNNPGMVSGMVKYNTMIKPKKIMQLTLEGKHIATFHNAKEASIATGVCSRNISQVANKTEFAAGRVRKQAGGFRWESITGIRVL